MKKIILLPLLAMVAFLSGCSSFSFTARQVDVRKTPIVPHEPTAGLVVDYSRQVTATSDYTATKKDAIAEAEFRCIQEQKIDVLIDPVFKIECRNSRMKNRYRATVIGFAGKYEQRASQLDETKNYSREEIENYKLLTDPEFPQYFYAQPEGDNYFIHSKDALKSAEVAPKSVMFRAPKVRAPKKVKQYDFHKAMQLRNAGIGLLCAGVACIGGGLGMVFGSHPIYDKGRQMQEEGRRLENESWGDDAKISQGQEMRQEGERLSTLASRLELGGMMVTSVASGMAIAGIPMIAVGAVRLNKARKMDITFNAGGNGVGVGLTF